MITIIYIVIGSYDNSARYMRYAGYNGIMTTPSLFYYGGAVAAHTFPCLIRLREIRERESMHVQAFYSL